MFDRLMKRRNDYKTEFAKIFKLIQENKLSEISYFQLDQILESTSHIEKNGYNENSGVRLNMKWKRDGDALISLSKFKLPKLDYINIETVPSDDENIRNFLQYSIPEKLESFQFNYSHDILNNIILNKYFWQLRLAVSKNNKVYSALEYKNVRK